MTARIGCEAVSLGWRTVDHVGMLRLEFVPKLRSRRMAEVPAVQSLCGTSSVVWVSAVVYAGVSDARLLATNRVASF